MRSNADIFASSSPVVPESQGVFNLFNDSANSSVTKQQELRRDAVSSANSSIISSTASNLTGTEEEKKIKEEKIEVIEY